jgi:hypothetical protein
VGAIGVKPPSARKMQAWEHVNSSIERFLALPKAHEQVLRRGR